MCKEYEEVKAPEDDSKPAASGNLPASKQPLAIPENCIVPPVHPLPPTSSIKSETIPKFEDMQLSDIADSRAR
ncbi:hypothetical protein TVAG_094590 [Trichomonas vaginalis G3]|uniref:Uncharacterized protein n=1 Tax=Trichomonas vaginalis (strain ATCC PRA-98 / G3) TaxID=412133 RepID=A2DBT1_TRIV3|nr:hypothetical protein TVAGG3_0380600 [Trichomonas vaginalis G3]EAY22284.1 hypothetical protein TVAG_094590 [Trichomonas vaginalis G3]KAI5533245.1 hypothetical protein TVAGG3_0380600 [Trichomonas vaginalis G3]|eukprot:XP_001583270.1 hypothetical protein [Trichomonas vaginalis G3]